jgi:hypothetical protein
MIPLKFILKAPVHAGISRREISQASFTAAISRLSLGLNK